MSNLALTILEQIRNVASQSNRADALTPLLVLLEGTLQGKAGEEPAVSYPPGETPSDYDPRATNCRFHSPANDPTTGVWLTYHKVNGVKYWLESVELVNEADAGGRHFITVIQPDGLEVALATGYNGGIEHFDAIIKHAPGQDLILDGHGEPPNLGPYAVFLLDGQGRLASDVIASFMLPWGHHVCYVCKFVRADNQ